MSRWLVVEDDEVFGTLLVRGLQRKGYAARLATTPVQALQQLAEQEFEFATLDLHLDNESGLALLPQLLAQQPELQVLVLTGYASIATCVDAIKLGAVQYLPKPARVDDIIAALDTVEPDPEQPLTQQPLSPSRLEWEHIQQVLKQHEGNVSATARALNMHRRTLQRKLQKKPVAK